MLLRLLPSCLRGWRNTVSEMAAGVAGVSAGSLACGGGGSSGSAA